MKRVLRGLSRITIRFPAIVTTIPTLTGLLVLSSNSAYGQVILDDFSANNVLNYNFVEVFGSPANNWTVLNGELHPNVDGEATAAWFWKGSEKLSAAGDSLSISLSLKAGEYNDLSFSTSIGLAVAADTALTGFHFISLNNFGGSWSGGVDGDNDQIASPPSGLVQLTIQRTSERTEFDEIRYSVSFSGGGLSSPITKEFAESSESLLVGVFAQNTTGTPAAMDNLTFTAVPEPSMYAGVFGLLALGTVVFRAQTARRS